MNQPSLLEQSRRTRRVTDADDHWAARDRRIDAARGDSILNLPQPKTLNHKPFVQTARYIENLVMQCSDETFGQDAVEWAIMTGRFNPSYHLETDLEAIMGDPSQPTIPSTLNLSKEPRLYDSFVEQYQTRQQADADALFQSASPLLDQVAALRQIAA